MTFKDLELNKDILKAIDESGYINPTPIQEEAIPHILNNKDIFGCAQTGTGKTAAFAIPIIQTLHNKVNSDNRKIKALIITPTRELAIQIRDNFRKYGKYTNLKTSVVLGGVNQRSQVRILKEGVDILVATPGRLLDLMKQKHIDTRFIETVVLDESDTMLDMGFITDVKKIIAKLPEEHQTLLFSATMPPEINKLATSLLKDYVTIKIDAVSSAAPNIKQSLYFVNKNNKKNLLIDILNKEDINSVLIFTRTKIGADKLARSLREDKIICEVIHGDKQQRQRVAALKKFKSGISKILIATDVAAHGIDIKGLSHVINYDLPDQAETYVHRIGRTGRAGLDGIAISFCDKSEKKHLISIQKLIKQDIYVEENHDYHEVQTSKLTFKNKANNKRGNYRNNSFKRNDDSKRSDRSKRDDRPRKYDDSKRNSRPKRNGYSKRKESSK